MVASERRGRSGRWLVLLLIVCAAVAILLVLDQWEKWTCGPPDGVWVESPDQCVELP
ncbi:MAG: hypothetical protein M3280_04580 [Actinomycetota bacterium]|nr:hypothetical protein [Actinomycetota bacterium]